MTTTFGKQPQPNHALAPSSPRARSQEKPAPRWWREAALVTTIYVAYDASRGLHRGNVHTATSNGTSVYRLERTAHLDPETWLNHGLHSLPALAVAAAYFYATLHFIVTPAVLVWMYRAHPNEYRRARTWLATATVSALAGFWLFPVAPPRLLHNSAIHDTLGRRSNLGMVERA